MFKPIGFEGVKTGAPTASSAPSTGFKPIGFEGVNEAQSDTSGGFKPNQCGVFVRRVLQANGWKGKRVQDLNNPNYGQVINKPSPDAIQPGMVVWLRPSKGTPTEHWAIVQNDDNGQLVLYELQTSNGRASITRTRPLSNVAHRISKAFVPVLEQPTQQRRPPASGGVLPWATRVAADSEAQTRRALDLIGAGRTVPTVQQILPQQPSPMAKYAQFSKPIQALAAQAEATAGQRRNEQLVSSLFGEGTDPVRDVANANNLANMRMLSLSPEEMESIQSSLNWYTKPMQWGSSFGKEAAGFLARGVEKSLLPPDERFRDFVTNPNPTEPTTWLGKLAQSVGENTGAAAPLLAPQVGPAYMGTAMVAAAAAPNPETGLPGAVDIGKSLWHSWFTKEGWTDPSLIGSKIVDVALGHSVLKHLKKPKELPSPTRAVADRPRMPGVSDPVRAEALIESEPPRAELYNPREELALVGHTDGVADIVDPIVDLPGPPRRGTGVPSGALAQGAPPAVSRLVGNIIPTARVRGISDGWRLELPSGYFIDVRWKRAIPLDEQTQQRLIAQGEDPAQWTAGGAWEIMGKGSRRPINQLGIIWLSKQSADATTPFHEVFHAVWGIKGLLSDAERAALLKKYGDVESICDAYAAWVPSQPHTTFQRIYDLFKNIYDYVLRPTEYRANAAFRRTVTGDVWESLGADPREVRRAIADGETLWLREDGDLPDMVERTTHLQLKHLNDNIDVESPAIRTALSAMKKIPDAAFDEYRANATAAGLSAKAIEDNIIVMRMYNEMLDNGNIVWMDVPQSTWDEIVSIWRLGVNNTPEVAALTSHRTRRTEMFFGAVASGQPTVDVGAYVGEGKSVVSVPKAARGTKPLPFVNVPITYKSLREAPPPDWKYPLMVTGNPHLVSFRRPHPEWDKWIKTVRIKPVHNGSDAVADAVASAINYANEINAHILVTTFRARSAWSLLRFVKQDLIPTDPKHPEFFKYWAPNENRAFWWKYRYKAPPGSVPLEPGEPDFAKYWRPNPDPKPTSPYAKGDWEPYVPIDDQQLLLALRREYMRTIDRRQLPPVSLVAPDELTKAMPWKARNPTLMRRELNKLGWYCPSSEDASAGKWWWPRSKQLDQRILSKIDPNTQFEWCDLLHKGCPVCRNYQKTMYPEAHGAPIFGLTDEPFCDHGCPDCWARARNDQGRKQMQAGQNAKQAGFGQPDIGDIYKHTPTILQGVVRDASSMHLVDYVRHYLEVDTGTQMDMAMSLYTSGKITIKELMTMQKEALRAQAELEPTPTTLRRTGPGVDAEGVEAQEAISAQEDPATAARLEYQLQKQDTLAVLDEAGGSRVELAEYYRRNPEKWHANLAAWFGNSVVKDADGRPLVFYHGTTADIDAFSPLHTKDGFGWHFGLIGQASDIIQTTQGLSDDLMVPRTDVSALVREMYSERYYKPGANIYPVYLRIENPIKLVRDPKAWYPTDMLQALPQNVIEELTALDPEFMSDYRQGARAIDLARDKVGAQAALGKPYNGQLKQRLQRLGYDGFAYINEIEGLYRGVSDEDNIAYVAWSPEQIKSAWNLGTFNRDEARILYHLKRLFPIQDGERFIENSKEILSDFAKARKWLHSEIAPASVSDVAAAGAALMREQFGEYRRSIAVFHAAYDGASLEWNRLVRGYTDAERRAAYHQYETLGRFQDPVLAPFGPYLQAIAAAERDMIRSIKGADYKAFVDNYLPHIYKQPALVQRIMADIHARRLKVSPTWLKQRRFPTAKEAWDLGEQLKAMGYIEDNPFELVSTNPFEVQALRYQQVAKWKMGQDIMNALKMHGLAVFVRTGKQPPIGWRAIPDPIARVASWQDVRTSQRAKPSRVLIERGTYYAPADVARLIENHLGPTAWSNPVYARLRNFSNVMNQMNLGFSLFHAIFTGLDSSFSEGALGTMKLVNARNWRGALSSQAKAAVPFGSVPGNYLVGRQLMREYAKPGSGSRAIQAAVNKIMQGGGVSTMKDLYTNEVLDAMVEHWSRGEYLYGLKHAPSVLAELAAYPVLNLHVPMMKMANSMKLIDHLLEIHPDATALERKLLINQALESMDNRFGQLVYDNNFQRRLIRDAAMLGLRAYGWTLGSIREGTGAVADTVNQAVGVVRAAGKGKPVTETLPITLRHMTPRQAYVLDLATRAAIWGGITQMLMTGITTGEMIYPQSWMDFYFPRTGWTNDDGTDHRLSLPTYIKEAFAWGRHGIAHTLRNKMNPGISTLWSVIINKDWKSDEIREVSDPLWVQLRDVATFILAQYMPISVNNFQTTQNIEEGIGAFLGINKAPSYITQPADVRLLHELAPDYLDRSKYGQQLRREKSELRKLVREGLDKPEVLSEYRERAGALLKSGGIRNLQQFRKMAQRDEEEILIAAFKQLNPVQQDRVIEAAETPERRALYMKYAKSAGWRPKQGRLLPPINPRQSFSAGGQLRRR